MGNHSQTTIRIIGFGKHSEEILAEINSLGYEGVKAELYSENHIYSHTAEDLIILLDSPDPERMRKVAKAFREADVLTLAILDRDERCYADCIDAFTVVPTEDTAMTVKALIDPFFMPCSVAYDLEDLRSTIKDKYFLVTSGEGIGEDRIADAIKQATADFDKEKPSSIEGLSLILYHANNDLHTLMMSEIGSITEFLSTLPESAEMTVAMYEDATLPPGRIRISIISAGKGI